MVVFFFYDLGGFHFWFPYHNLVPSFRESSHLFEQNGDACFCGSAFGSVRHQGTGCHYSCTGNSQLKCGGQWRNDIFLVTNTPNGEYLFMSMLDG